MPRLSQARQIQQESEQQAIAFFEAMMAALVDPRRAQGKMYPLRTVVVISLMAMVCGCDDAQSMELWGEVNQSGWRGFSTCPMAHRRRTYSSWSLPR